MIEWEQIGRSRFERIVNALLPRIYSGAEVTDGRGGDGGRDAVVVQGDRVRIFQLKYFPDGFSASQRGRRSQIKRSFETAMQHGPYEWTLVVPCELTPGERDFVMNLGNSGGVRVSVVDRPRLDGWMATCPDLEASVTRDQFVEKAAILNQEKVWLLGGPGDLDERVRNLGYVVDGMDDHWTIDFARSGDDVMRRLRAKHSRAQELSPITCELQFTLGQDQHDLATAVERSFGFGTSEVISLPPEVVDRWRLVGPPWLSETREHVAVTLRPTQHTPRREAPVNLEFFDHRGKPVAAHEGVVRHVGSGDQGFCLEADFYGAASLRFLCPFDHGAGTLDADFRLVRADPGLALRTLKLNRELQTCDRLVVTIDNHSLGSFSFDQRRVSDSAQTNMLDDFESLVYDLDVVQRHCSTYFRLPETLEPTDRLLLRAARLLIEGHCVAFPGARILTVTLAGSDSDGLRQLLSGKPGVIRIENSHYPINIGDRELDLGRVSFFNSVIAEDHEKANHALDEGRAQGLQVHLRPANGHNFRAYMPDKITNPQQKLAPTPWGLPGVVEPN